MAAQALPPPGPGGGFPSPAPAQESGGAKQKLDLVMQIVSASRLLGQLVPGAIPEIRQINELAQRLQQKIIQTQPVQEPMAPPG